MYWNQIRNYKLESEIVYVRGGTYISVQHAVRSGNLQFAHPGKMATHIMGVEKWGSGY